MLFYYFELALRSFKAARGLTALMVLALALGIAACMTTLTVHHVLSGDPIPGKSDRLFNVQLDAAGLIGYQPGKEPNNQLTLFDAQALLRDHRAPRQVMMSGGDVTVQGDPGSAAFGSAGAAGAAEDPSKPRFTEARYTSADFFAMFEAPLIQGTGWSAADDESAAPVAVVAQALAERLFGSTAVLGRSLLVNGQPVRVVGVLGPWRPVPRFYDLSTGEYAAPEQIFMPFSAALAKNYSRSGNMNCWGEVKGDARALNAPCDWIQYWVELAQPADATAFKAYLRDYADAQRRAGRFERPPNERLRPVMDWLAHREVLPRDVSLQLWLAFGFLLVCLTNTVGLLLAKCLRRSGEIGVRRALGASRRAIFAQFLVEAGTLGLVGGALGLLLAWGGLWLVRQSPNQYAPLAQMDWAMLGLTVLLSLAASLLAGLLPAWRACGVNPAQQIKTQ
jgi:putative ABC transport system permease protein